MNQSEPTECKAPQEPDWKAIRMEFPALHQQVNDSPLVYFDHAATAQKPRKVIDAMTRYYELDNANVHRGVHHLSQRATRAYEEARMKTVRFIGAENPSEVIFTSGTTASINLVAQSWGSAHLKAGDEVLVTGLEHHANLVPWQMICTRTGAHLKIVPVNDLGEVSTESVAQMLHSKTRIFAFSWISNALGTINPAHEWVRLAHEKGITTLIDAAQVVAHHPIDVHGLGVDFLCFSAHKMMGPTGVGVLYGKKSILETLEPMVGGGDMIDEVTYEKSTWAELPYRLEAGTPNIAGVIGLSAAIDFLESIGWSYIERRESELLQYALLKLGSIPQIRFIGQPNNRAGVISFVVDGVHPYDLGTLLDEQGIALRTGHHCAQPLMRHFGISGTCRVSLALYNTFEEIDQLEKALIRALRLMGKVQAQ
jgi:cysteine desulfurase/selenocysteine lyase